MLMNRKTDFRCLPYPPKHGTHLPTVPFQVFKVAEVPVLTVSLADPELQLLKCGAERTSNV